MNPNISKLFTLILLAISTSLYSQADSTIVEGYVYETGNRGYLSVVNVQVNNANGVRVADGYTNLDGYFRYALAAGGAHKVIAIKDMFETKEMDMDLVAGSKNFAKIEMKRTPGYIFEITMAEKRESADTPVDAISDTRIEVYNNTTEKEELVYENYMEPSFRVNLRKGNHYTVLIRKDGFLAKRMEAFVDVDDCILCFEGIGSIRPGVSETMTEGNQNGLLLANVEMERVYTGKKMEINNVYYELDKARLTAQAKLELDNVIQLMKDNPRLSLELGSHTDSRGKSDYNMELSQRRAEACVAYLLESGDIRSNRITSQGYGESQITNKCVDGVYCNDAMHAANRRTELKITGIMEPTRFKPLAEMKREEKLERELLQGDEGEQQIELLPGETLEDALKRIEEEKKNGGTILNSGFIDQEVDEGNIIKEESPREKTRERVESDARNSGGLNIDAPGLSADAQGPMIALHIGDKLAMTNKLFKVFPNVRSYYDGEKHYYLIEKSYDDIMKANDYLMKNIKLDYPDAKVVMVDKGRVLR